MFVCACVCTTNIMHAYYMPNIYSNPQTVWLYHKSSVWLDTRDASRWDRNPADFLPVGYLTFELSSISA